MMASVPRHIVDWIRRIGVGLLWPFVILVLGGAISIVAMRLLGSVHGWQGWLEHHRFHLLTWRLALYATTLVGWCWMRKRLLLREPSARSSLRRTELGAIAAIVALECTSWLRTP